MIPPGVNLDEHDRIDHDVSCMHCGYNLRSCRPEDDCPECGRRIEDTLLRAMRLRADTKWRNRMVVGLNLILIVAVIDLILAVLYAGVFFTLICTGPGKFSVDASSSFRGLKLRE